MNASPEQFIEWTKLKIRLQFGSKKSALYFYEREIWWASLGINIGCEENGKHEKFERPVLVLKKFNKEILWVLPLTSKDKGGEYYYKFEYLNAKYSAILSQLRLISSKRLSRKITLFPLDNFNCLKEKLKNLL